MKKAFILVPVLTLFLTVSVNAKTPEGITPIKSTISSCVVGGCSNELCVNSSDKPVFSTCLWKEEYACLPQARCEVQSNGACGWTYTDEYNQCRGIGMTSPTPTLTQTSPEATISPTTVATPTFAINQPTSIPPSTEIVDDVHDIPQAPKYDSVPTPIISNTAVVPNSDSNKSTAPKLISNTDRLFTKLSQPIFTLPNKSTNQINKISEEKNNSIPIFYQRIQKYIKAFFPSFL